MLHATFEHHVYPVHTHDSWTVLLVDDGSVTYDPDRVAHRAEPASVALLPPHVPHDGRSTTRGEAFRKRVLYLRPDWLPEAAADRAVRTPTLADPAAVRIVHRIHDLLRQPADRAEAEHGLHLLRAAVRDHLGFGPARTPVDAPLAARLRRLLDDRLTEHVSIDEAARLLGVHPGQLVRSFSTAYGLPPHRYITGRRVDRARRLLLNGYTPARAAVESGFHDQSHLTRHFRRILGTTPGTFAGTRRARAWEGGGAAGGDAVVR